LSLATPTRAGNERTTELLTGDRITMRGGTLSTGTSEWLSAQPLETGVGVATGVAVG
jgi:hypothetical protein